MHILIADDDASFRLALSRYLEAREHEVTLAIDGREAERLIKETQPDLVLCDVRMPGFDGVELVRRMRADGIQIPVALMSGVKGLLDGIEEGEGVVAKLEKPFELETVEGLLGTEEE